ncbi:MAG: hypothetical protein U5L06_00765 [Rhodovibrio sp.]|nr:hypothetical protein [Rhodovibrio sp.]
MADKTMPTRGQVSEAADVVNVVASYVHCFGDENTWSAAQIADFIRRDLGRPDQKDALAEAIGTAAYEVAQMRYDSVEATAGYPRALRVLEQHIGKAWVEKILREGVTRVAGKEGDDGQ